MEDGRSGKKRESKRMRVEVNNREMWVEGRRWIWRGERGSWKEEEEM